MDIPLPQQPLVLDAVRHLQAARHRLEELAVLALPELLQRYGLLQPLLRELALEQLIDAIEFPQPEQAAVIQRLWDGLEATPPERLVAGWLEAQPEPLQPILRERWRELRRQKLLDQTYAHHLDSYFLERRADLEQIVYGMIRLHNLGAAEEIYLRLVDDQADFAELARQHSLGDERYTHGLVGPMAISQPHPRLREVLATLELGQVAPPLVIDTWVLILRLEHRQPAQLNDALRGQLLGELLEKDLEPLLARQAEQLLAPAPEPAAPAPVEQAGSDDPWAPQPETHRQNGQPSPQVAPATPGSPADPARAVEVVADDTVLPYLSEQPEPG